MAVVNKLLEQALQLSEKERGELAGRLLGSQESVEDEELAQVLAPSIRCR